MWVSKKRHDEEIEEMRVALELAEEERDDWERRYREDERQITENWGDFRRLNDEIEDLKKEVEKWQGLSRDSNERAGGWFSKHQAIEKEIETLKSEIDKAINPKPRTTTLGDKFYETFASLGGQNVTAVPRPLPERVAELRDERDALKERLSTLEYEERQRKEKRDKRRAFKKRCAESPYKNLLAKEGGKWRPVKGAVHYEQSHENGTKVTRFYDRSGKLLYSMTGHAKVTANA